MERPLAAIILAAGLGTVEPARQSRHPIVTGFLLDEAEALFSTVLAGNEKDVKKLGKQNERLSLLLRCLETGAGRAADPDPDRRRLHLLVWPALVCLPVIGLVFVRGQVDVLGPSPSNLCFGGPEGRTVYVTEVTKRRLVQFRTDRPGLAWKRWQKK